MLKQHRPARINIKVLVIVLVVLVALMGSLLAARQIRRSILSKRDLAAGQAAYGAKDWPTAFKHFQEFLGRNPDNIEILRKFAEARLSIQPFEPAGIPRAVAAYRRIIQLDPLDEAAYDELARLYGALRNFDELAYIARKRLGHCPDDKKAPLWLAEALIFQDKMQEAQDALETYIAEIEALPSKNEEYVRAYLLMSRLMDSDEAIGARLRALAWLKSAVYYAPSSVEALVQRAKFYLGSPDLPGMSNEQRQNAARKDIEAADALGTDNPHLRFSLGTIWMTLGELDRAGAELQAVETLDQASLKGHYLDLKDWLISKYFLGSELALRRGVPTEAASLADETLSQLEQPGHRMRILPSTIRVYVAANRIADARQYLNEYTEAWHTLKGTQSLDMTLAYVQALVAQAEGRPYTVIEVVDLAVAENAAPPELWRLLVRAYEQTGQSKQTVNTLTEYLRVYPQDGDMALQLAQTHLKLRQWKQALETASRIESLLPKAIQAKLLRIEAAIHLAAEQPDTDAVKLRTLAAELAKLREMWPERADIRRLQAGIAAYLGQLDQVEQELLLALEECEESLGTRLQLARYYVRAKRMDAALEVGRKACEHHAEAPEVWLSMAHIQETGQDYDAARNSLRQGLDSVVGRWERRTLSMGLAMLEVMHGDRNVGIALLSELAEQDARDIHVRTFLLGVREIREDRATRERLIQELKQAEGGDGLSWRYHQASLWMASSDWRAEQQAIADSLLFCLEQDPQWSSPAVLLLELYERQRDFRRFEDTCRRVLLRHPGATRVSDLLISFLEKQRRFTESEEVLRQMEANSPMASAWQVRMALRAGDVSRAAEELKLRISNDDQDIASRILLARLLYQETGDVAQAFAQLKEAEAIAPDSKRLIAAKVSILRAAERAEEGQRLLDDYVTRQNTFDAYELRAAYLSLEGQLDSAEQDYRKLTTFTEQGAIGVVLLSSFFVRHENLDAAVETLEQGLISYPGDLRLQNMLMQTLTRRGSRQDQQKALAILATLEEQLPQNPELMKLRVAQLLKEPTPQSIQQAQEKLEQIVAMESTAVKAYLTLIAIAMRTQEYETAHTHVIRALGANPDNPDLMAARSAVELALGNTPMASDIARLALQKDPNQIQALGILLTTARRSQDPKLLEEIRELIRAAIIDNPAHDRLQLMRAQVLVSQDLPNIAIRELDAYCQTKAGRSSAGALVMLASLHRQSGDMEQAKEKLDQVEQLGPDFPALIDERLNWITSLYQAGNADQAQRLFRELLAQHPANAKILNNLAWLLQDQYQQYEEALELVNQGLNLAPDDLHILDTRGTILLMLPDRQADARRDFSRLVELSPEDSPRKAKSLLQLGRLCAKDKDLAQARQHLLAARAIDRRIDVFTQDERTEITKILEPMP